MSVQPEQESFVLRSELSQKTGINKSLISYYEEKGLIKAFTTVGPKDMRVYNLEETLGRLRKIKALKKQKKTLDEIKNILNENNI